MSQEQKGTESDEILTGADQYKPDMYAPAKTKQVENPPANQPSELASIEAFRAKYYDLLKDLPYDQQQQMYRKALVKQQGKEAAEHLEGAMKQKR